MIEMLGVLAIIGVLSAGGIMGYSAAMENHKVNKTIDMYQKGMVAVHGLFKKRGGGVYRDQVLADGMCSAGVLPEDICKTGTGDTRKGYFGEVAKFGVAFWNRVEATDGSVAFMEKEKPDGSVVKPRVAPVTMWQEWVSSRIPSSTCVKLLTHPAWENVGDITFVVDLGDKVQRMLPMKISVAKTNCKLEEKASSYTFIIYTLLDTQGIDRVR